MSELQSVETSQREDGIWQSYHIPSGKKTEGQSQEEAVQSMRQMLGMTDSNTFTEPLTSDRFEGKQKEIAMFLEGEISEMLALHSGFARLEGMEQGVAYIKLGGGCSGCPSSTLTLVQGVKEQLQEKFGEETIMDVAPSL